MPECGSLRTKAELAEQVKRMQRALTALKFDVDALPSEKQLVAVRHIKNTPTTPIMQAVQSLINAHDEIDKEKFGRGERPARERRNRAIEQLREHSQATI